MASEVHLAVFGQGAYAWNAWRSSEPAILPDLSDISTVQLDLSGFDLSHTNLVRANLSNVRFGDCNLTEANLREAILRNADLASVRGLIQPSQVAGADLSGAYIPVSLKDAIGNLDVAKGISGNAQKLFVVVLGACFYSWLTIATTTDFGLITNRSSSPLPILQTAIQIAAFYMIAPVLLLGIFFYFHLYLQNLWDELGSQPAIFPDGRPLHAKADPWLISDLIQSQLYRLRDRLPFLAYLQVWIAGLVAWWFVPLTLAGLWLRYLPRHDAVGTSLHCVLIAIASAGAFSFYRLARSTLRGTRRHRLSWRFAPLSRTSWEPIWAALATGLLFGLVSFGAMDGVRQRSWLHNSDAPATWVPSALKELDYVPFANLDGAELSTKPANWAEKSDPNFEQIVGFQFPEGKLRYSDMAVAFLPKANLQKADLEGTELTAADLRGAHLADANLKTADLEGTHLENADLTRANLTGANLLHTKLDYATLSYADFQNAMGLDPDEVQKAKNWCEGQYPDVVLKAFHLSAAFNQRIQAHEKRDTNLELANANAKEAARLREIENQHPNSSLEELMNYAKSAGVSSSETDNGEDAPAVELRVKPIPWPNGQEPIPAPLASTPSTDAPLPTADYVVITWTAVEATALADVLLPGYKWRSWYQYGHFFDSKFKESLRPGSPAASAGILGRYFLVTIGGRRVLCFKSELHLSTDGPDMPVLNLFEQIVQETRPKLVISTGTAGDLSGNLNIGDVAISSSAEFRCTRFCKQKPMAEIEVSDSVYLPAEQLDYAQKNLMPSNWSELKGERTEPPTISWKDTKILSTDAFTFADVKNTYGIDGKATVVDMGDALLGIAMARLGSAAPKWLSIRNVSDPVVCGDSVLQEAEDAAGIYRRYGYWTTVQSAIATWAVISGSR